MTLSVIVGKTLKHKNIIEKVEEQREKISLLYNERNMLVCLLTKMAQKLNLETGLGVHEDDGENWPKESKTVIYIELPSGQISFHCPLRDEGMFSHLPPHSKKWDRHSRDLKWNRIMEPKL